MYSGRLVTKSEKCVTLVSLVVILLKTTGLGFRISELQSQLDEALNELEKLRESRHHQLQLVESIVRQRDMFRILLAQTTGAVIPLQGQFCASVPIVTSFQG